jgi:hypothetical protein
MWRIYSNPDPHGDAVVDVVAKVAVVDGCVDVVAEVAVVGGWIECSVH